MLFMNEWNKFAIELEDLGTKKLEFVTDYFTDYFSLL